MKQYSVYKASGLSFIDKVPEHWEVKRAKYFFREIDERSEAGNEELLSVSHITGVTPRSEKNITMFMAESYEGFKLCHPDDLVINIMWAWMGALGLSRHRGIVSSSYGVYRLRDKSCFDSVYLDYLARIPEYVAEYHRRSQGIRSSRLRMYSDDFFQIPIFCPPIDEQRRIVTYINHKLAQIDQFICYKRRLIELLNEQKTALINRTLTRGLNPDVPMKESGIHWIGEIPEHWGISVLGYVCRLTSGGTPDRNRQEYWNGEIPWVKTGEINYNEIRETEEYITEVGLKNSSAKLASPGTVLMGMYGQGVTRGRVAVLGIEAAFNQACLAMYPCNLLKTKYLYYYLTSAYEYIRDTGNETSQMNLSAGLISKVRVLLPNLEEQSQILEFLDKEFQKIKLAIAQAEKEIELIQEYRTTLISDTVTGKIDVRDYAEVRDTAYAS
ncbi:MAG: restriction endonuclease subunit S [Coleofasciculus sp. S288]|nr:restriction endonuclease subunit S [Coleofasciculus sp. S288]